jgi:hypothetical protein
MGIAEKPIHNNGFKKGHTLSTGRPKGSKNIITKDVRACFAKVYEALGEHLVNKEGNPMSGDEAMLEWAKDNQSQFYVLFSKMIETKVVLDDDSVESWLDGQIFNEHQSKLINADAVDVTDVGNEELKQLSGGDNSSTNAPPDSDTPTSDPHLV